VVRILTTGSRNPALQQVATAIFDISIAYQVKIEPEWISMEVNQQANFISGIIDYDNWSLHPELFQALDKKWGLHTIDRFASYFNTQLPRFNTRFCNSGSERVDTFICDWQGANTWWYPPVYLVPRVLCHAQTNAIRALVVPKWPSASFWPVLFTAGGKLSLPGVQATEEINKSEVVICPGRSGLRREPIQREA